MLWLERTSFIMFFWVSSKILQFFDASLYRYPKMPDLSSMSNQNGHKMWLNRPIVFIKSVRNVRKCWLISLFLPSNSHNIWYKSSHEMLTADLFTGQAADSQGKPRGGRKSGRLRDATLHVENTGFRYPGSRQSLMENSGVCRWSIVILYVYNIYIYVIIHI